MANLLAKVCARPSRVRIPCGDVEPQAVLKEFIDDRIIPVLFPDTIGGTELDMMLDAGGIGLDEQMCGRSSGNLRMTGTLVLDDVPVRVQVEVALDTMSGWAQLSLIEDPQESERV